MLPTVAERSFSLVCFRSLASASPPFAFLPTLPFSLRELFALFGSHSQPPCWVEMSTVDAPAEQDLLLNPLDQLNQVYPITNPFPDDLIFSPMPLLCTA